MLEWHSKVIKTPLHSILHSTKKRMSLFFPVTRLVLIQSILFVLFQLYSIYDVYKSSLLYELWLKVCLVIKYQRFGRTCYFDEGGMCLWNKWFSTVPRKRGNDHFSVKPQCIVILRKVWVSKSSALYEIRRCITQ